MKPLQISIFFFLVISGSMVTLLSGIDQDEKQIEKKLNQKATLVVVGKVEKIQVTRETGRGEERIQSVLATLIVSAVEKGTAVKPGATISVRYTRRKGPNNNMFPGILVHDPSPKVGDEVRVYLTKELKVIEPNGFVISPNSTSKTVKAAPKTKNASDIQKLLQSRSERMAAMASHVVLARVKSIKPAPGKPKNLSGVIHRDLLATLEIQDVTKGDGVAAGDAIEVAYFEQILEDDQKKTIRKPLNFETKPSVGSTVKVLLSCRNKGQYRVMFPFGFTLIEDSAPEKEAKGTSSNDR